ncbi:MAG: hypothetical protein OXR07_09630 [Nitrospira sp.]|nr:hypothetical protein [Nitrospira sp.]
MMISWERGEGSSGVFTIRVTLTDAQVDYRDAGRGGLSAARATHDLGLVYA